MPSYRQILKQSWDAFFENIWLFLGLELLAIFVLSLAANLPFIGWVFNGVFILGILKLCDRIIKKQDFEFYDLFWYTRDFKTLMAAIVVVFAYQFFLVLALIAFILPGIWFFIAASYYLLAFTFDEKKQTGIEAIKTSLALVKGRWSEQLIFLMVLAVVNLVGVLFFGIGIFISIPISFLGLYFMFNHLYFKDQVNESPKDPAQQASSLIQVRPE